MEQILLVGDIDDNNSHNNDHHTCPQLLTDITKAVQLILQARLVNDSKFKVVLGTPLLSLLL